MTGVKLEDLPEPYRAQARSQLRAARPAPHMERGAGHGAVEEEEAARPDRPALLVYRQRRKRLTDPDGACSKYVTDALVSCGVFADDSAKEIEEVRYEQKKTEKGEAEQTIVEVWI